MRVSVLMEDATSSPQFVSEHGLSFYVETVDGSLLFDTGASDLFLQNAKTLGISLADVRWSVLSHGHNDHGGGISAFLRENGRAKVYAQAGALEGHYTTRKSGAMEEIGLPSALAEEPRVVLTNGDLRLTPSLLLFSSVTGRSLLSGSNRTHLICGADGVHHDHFSHEQSLLLSEQGRTVLIAGCAHRGIVNIVSRAMELAGRPMDAVVGGFHLSNPRDGGCEPFDLVDGVADFLSSLPTEYYTCHCTGALAFSRIKERLGRQLHLIAAGDQFTI